VRLPRFLHLERFRALRELKRWLWVTLNIWENADTAVRDVIRQYVGPGMRCIDIGAHRGRMTELMLKAGAGAVFAFEPLPDLCHALEEKYRNQNVYPFCVALSDHQGCEDFYRTELPLMSSFKPFDLEGGRIIETLKVQVECLDSYGFVNIDFIKIDVEGFEMEVLRGAEQTIRKYHPTVVAECLPNSKNKDNMIWFFRSHGYKTIRYEYEILAVKE
jgi:FkbM family methyltransferase